MDIVAYTLYKNKTNLQMNRVWHDSSTSTENKKTLNFIFKILQSKWNWIQYEDHKLVSRDAMKEKKHLNQHSIWSGTLGAQNVLFNR